MKTNGREDLFNYTYLNANGYLNKFRNALNLPNLQLSTLAAILKTFKDKCRLAGFIGPNREGKMCLYYKKTLNAILGMTDDGHFVIKPEQNSNLQMLRKILDRWDEEEVMRSTAKEIPFDDPNDETDMQKASDKLIHDDNYLEEKKMKGKKIYITESQFDSLKKMLSEQYFVEPEKVGIVKKYLDDNFVRGGLPAIGEDGYPKTIGVVGMKFKDGTVAKNMTATQLFYLLQDKFNKIYEDPKQRDAFLKKIVVDWYYKRINNGLLSKNNY